MKPGFLLLLFTFFLFTRFSLALEPFQKFEFGKNVIDDPIHKTAVEKVIVKFGLSSTGRIYFTSKFQSAVEINNFCNINEEIFEYRTSHLVSCLFGIYWYNPKNGKLLEIYSIQKATKDQSK